MQTPATGFLRSLPETLAGIRGELETRKERLVTELAALDHDLAHIASLEAVAAQRTGLHLMEEAA
jgi:hypothetical protein